MTITAKELRRLFVYNPNTGEFVRAVDAKRGKAKAGDRAGYVENTGYSAFWANGKKYLAHRLAWLYMPGDWPAGQIDHIDGDRLNNRFDNLRDVSNGENQQNVWSAKKHNSHGLLGVSKSKNRFKAEIRANGIRRHIGTFDTPEEAHQAYLKAKAVLHIPGGVK